MADAFAGIREKAQAHQEESKAKRFRDRGGLFQPLSPSKNMLLRILNSAEFRNISEGAAIEMPPMEKEPFQPEAPQMIGVAGNTKPATKAKRKALATGNRDDLPHKVKKPTKDPAKPKKSKAKGKSAAVATVDIAELDSGDEVSTLSGRKSSRTSGNSVRLRKSSIIKASRPKVVIARVSEDLQAESSIQGTSTRARVTRKRNARGHISDNEGDELTEHPSPVKKPRSRPNTKTRASATIPESTRQAASAYDEQGEGNLGLEDDFSNEKKGKRKREHIDPEAVGTSKSPSTRRSKRAPIRETSSDDEQLSPPKRRCTTTSNLPGYRSKTANIGNDAPFEIMSPDRVELLTPVQKPKREAPIKKNSTRTAGGTSGGAGDSGIDASLHGSRIGENGVFCHGHLSTIIEDEGSLEGNGKNDEVRIKKSTKITRHPPSAFGAELVPQDFNKPILPRSRRTPVANDDKNRPEAEDGSFIPSQAPMILEKHGKIDVEPAVKTVGGGVDNKNSRAGMTKRRRKKMSPEGDAAEPVGVHLNPIKATTTQDIERLHSKPIVEAVETDKPQRSRRTNSKQIVSLYAESLLPSGPSPPRQRKRQEDEASFNDLTVKKAGRSKAKTKTHPRLAEPQSNHAPDDFSPPNETIDGDERSAPKHKRAARKQKPPPLRDHMHLDNALESDIDELDLLS